MNYSKLVDQAIANNEVIDLLCGTKGYKLIVPQFAPDVLPTDVETVLHECIYKQKKELMKFRNFLKRHCIKC